jgi:hypothetical protein
MRRAFLALLVLLAASAPACGQIVDYGMYAVTAKACHPTGALLYCEIADATHLVTATNIPGKLGVTFGFNYALDSGGTPVRLVVIFPPAGLHNPRFPVAHDFKTDQTCSGQCFSCYSFQFPWEIVPGIWTFQVWANGQVVAQKQFNVYLPDKGKGKPGKGKLVASAMPQPASIRGASPQLLVPGRSSLLTEQHFLQRRD